MAGACVHATQSAEGQRASRRRQPTQGRSKVWRGRRRGSTPSPRRDHATTAPRTSLDERALGVALPGSIFGLWVSAGLHAVGVEWAQGWSDTERAEAVSRAWRR